jgi:hypothetical protein
MERQEILDYELSNILRNQLQLALPDLIAAADLTDEEADQAIEIFTCLTIRHYEDIWAIYSFNEKSGSLGEGTGGDVFAGTNEDGTKVLRFDGTNIDASLVECAFPLSQLFKDNRSLGSVFRNGLYAWSLTKTGDMHAVERFRREHGISEEDVRYWKSELGKKTMSSEERDQWTQNATAILTKFGDLVAPPIPGMVLQNKHFKNLGHFSEAEIQLALQKIALMPPLVNFSQHNSQQLKEIDLIPFIAQAAEKRSGNWSEQLLNELRAKAESACDGENSRIQYLDFDPAKEIKLRLGVEEADPAAGDAAIAFANGEILLCGLPTEKSHHSLQSLASTSSHFHAMDPQSSEDYVKEARRRASGGLRAEEAVLRLAVKNAMDWKNSDLASFQKALEPILSVNCLGEKGIARSKSLSSDKEMRDFLHASDYIGNLGFDVLVPNKNVQGSYAFLLVEVKRLAQLKNGVFYLSENERRRAAAYKQNALDWRLWLVSSNLEHPEDMTDKVLTIFATHSESLASMEKDGLRPGEWLLKLS